MKLFIRAIFLYGVISSFVIFIMFNPFESLRHNYVDRPNAHDGKVEKDEIMKKTLNIGNVTVGKSLGIFEDKTLQQNDTLVIDYIKKWHLHPPSPRTLNYNLTGNVNSNPSQMISTLMKIFKGKRDGIFIEAGARDGELSSNTLEFEETYNWTGLLVEPNRFLLTELFGKNRKAWISNACLSIIPRPQQMTLLHRTGNAGNQYRDWFKGNGIIEYISAGKSACFPLFSILSAINLTKIDFFSLDIEGVELKILKTIPFDLVEIKVIVVKFKVIPEGPQALQRFMKRKGYKTYLATARDYVFIKNDFPVDIGLEEVLPN